MNVSELTDVELNRAMIWLYGPTWILTHGKYRDQGQDVIEMALSYLTDWNLTMPLAVENSLCIELYNPLTYTYDNHHCSSMASVSTSNKNPLRAICEVLVMIKMESK